MSFEGHQAWPVLNTRPTCLSLPNATRILEKFQLYLSNLVIKVTVTPQWFIAIPGKPCTSWTWRSSGAAGGRSQSTDWRPWEKFVDDKFTLPTLQVLISLWIRGQHARNSFRGSHENHLATRSEIIGNLQLLLETLWMIPRQSSLIFDMVRSRYRRMACTSSTVLSLPWSAAQQTKTHKTFEYSNHI